MNKMCKHTQMQKRHVYAACSMQRTLCVLMCWTLFVQLHGTLYVRIHWRNPICSFRDCLTGGGERITRMGERGRGGKGSKARGATIVFGICPSFGEENMILMDFKGLKIATREELGERGNDR